MLASAPPDHYRRALAAMLRDDQVDSVIAIFIPPLVTEPDAVARPLPRGAASDAAKPVLGVFMRAEGAPAALGRIPSYAFPESAAVALARVTAYGRWRAHAADGPWPLRGIRPKIRFAEPRQAVLARGGGWTTPDEGQSLLSAVGIATPASRVALTAAEVVEAARQVATRSPSRRSARPCSTRPNDRPCACTSRMKRRS